jgi:serine/threonine-protein kinase
MERVILKALAKNPDDRFATAADFLAAWKQALREAEGVTEHAPAQTIAMASAATTAHPTAPVPASSAASPAAQAARPAARPALSLGLIGLLTVGLVGICALVVVGGLFVTRGLIPPTSQETPSPSVAATPNEIGSILATVTQFASEGSATVEAIMATVTAAGGNVTALPPASPTLIPPTAIPISRGLRVTQQALLESDLAKQVA